MNVTVEEKGEFDRRLTVTIPAERVDALLDKHLSTLARGARVPGFRPGRAPMNLIESMYRRRLEEQVAGDLIQETLFEAISKESLRPVASPAVEPGPLSRGQDYVYVAALQVFPHVEPKGYEGIAISRPVATVSDADIDGVIAKIRENQSTFQAQEDHAAEKGDQVVIDFVGKIDGVAFPGGAADDYPLDLGSGRFIGGFEEQLEGAKAGEEREVTVTFPDAYPAEELKGKEAVFSCTVKEVKVRVLPEIDEELAKKAGVAEGGVDKLKEDIRANLQEEAKKASEGAAKRQILDALVRENPMELPDQLVRREVDDLMTRGREEMRMRGMDGDNVADEVLRPIYEKTAIERVTLGLLIGAISKKESITISEEQVDARLEELSAKYPDAKNIKDYYRNNPERLEGLKGGLLEQGVMDWISERSTVTEEPLSFGELMQRYGSQES